MAGIENSKILWLNVSNGFLTNKKLNVNLKGYAGKVVGISTKLNEYNGIKMEKVSLKLQNLDKSDEFPEDYAVVQFNIKSWYSKSFFERITQVNFADVLTIGVYNDPKKNEKVCYAWMKQNEQSVDRNPDFPAPKKVTVNGEQISDFTEVIEASREVIKKLQSILRVDKPSGNTPTATTDVANNEEDDSF